MPPIKRWFPVSHDINQDPEVWILTDKFGDRALRIWLEILSIADRNEGLLGSSSTQLHAVLASKCRVYSPKVRTILGWCLTQGWLELRDGLRVVNYSKYHRTRVTNQAPSEPSEPTRPKHTRPSKTPIVPKGDGSVDLAFEKFWANYSRKVGKGSAYRAWCKEAKLSRDVQDQIFTALGWQKNQEQWTKERGRFIPHPATWLNQRRWLDEKIDQPEKQLSERTLRILRRGL